MGPDPEKIVLPDVYLANAFHAWEQVFRCFQQAGLDTEVIPAFAGLCNRCDFFNDKGQGFSGQTGQAQFTPVTGLDVLDIVFPDLQHQPVVIQRCNLE